MKTSKFTEHQIVSILKQQEAGVKVVDLCWEHGTVTEWMYDHNHRHPHKALGYRPPVLIQP